MIEVFKMIRGIDKVNLGKLFCIDEDERTRKHKLCLKISDWSFFTRRVINYWNYLTDIVVSCKFMTAKEEI